MDIMKKEKSLVTYIRYNASLIKTIHVINKLNYKT